MRKIYSSGFLCKVLLFLLLPLAIVSRGYAQSDISIGTGTTGNTGTSYPCPMQDYFEGSRMQYLYLASELAAAGMSPGPINAIKYNITALNTATVIENYSIKIGATSLNSLVLTGWETVSSSVYGPVNYTPVAGINTFTFSTPFNWNGTDNIIIEVCNGSPDAPTETTFSTLPFHGQRACLLMARTHTG